MNEENTTQSEQKVPKYNIEKSTYEAPTETQRQPSEPKMNGIILANQRIDRLKKTYSKHTRNDDTNDKEYKMEEDDVHTTNIGEDNMVDVNVKSTLQ